MGQRRLLTAFSSALLSSNFATWSWGTFSGTLRIKTIYFFCGDVTATRTLFGLFTSNSPDTPAGSFVNPFTGLPGWTRIHEPASGPIGNSDDTTGLFLPFIAANAAAPLNLQNVDLDLTGDLFYLKAYVRNSSAAGITVHIALTVEENPADAVGAVIDVRVPPGAPAPAGTTPGAPPPPAPTVPTPGPAGPAAGPSLLPKAEDAGIPPVRISPRDPMNSSRELCK